MNPFRLVSARFLGAVFMTASLAHGAAYAPSSDDPNLATQAASSRRKLEQVLIEKGLSQDDRKYLLNEGPAITKFNQTQLLYAEYEKAMLKQMQIAEYDENLANLQMQWQTLQQQAGALQQQINSVGNVHPRLRTMVNAQLAPLRQQHAALLTQANQLKAQVSTAQAQSPKPDDRKKAAAEVEKTGQACFKSARELELLVTPLMAQYHELALDPQVSESLTQLRHETTRNYKLGPSDELRTAAKILKNLHLTPARSARTPAVARHKPAF